MNYLQRGKLSKRRNDMNMILVDDKSIKGIIPRQWLIKVVYHGFLCVILFLTINSNNISHGQTISNSERRDVNTAINKILEVKRAINKILNKRNIEGRKGFNIIKPTL